MAAHPHSNQIPRSQIRAAANELFYGWLETSLTMDEDAFPAQSFTDQIGGFSRFFLFANETVEGGGHERVVRLLWFEDRYFY